jgi:hypothetical protein
MVARHHHYLSQCYLRGFTSGNGKNSKLTVFDFKEKRHFETIPRNVGGIRDFNRIEVEGFPSDYVENGLAEFEGLAATALRNVSEGAAFEGENKHIILNLIALLASRSPEKREQWRKFQSQIAEQIMSLSLATEERWVSQIAQMKKSGKKVNEDISYADIKKFIDSKEYKIEVPREFHIHLEMEAVKALLPYLTNRNWLVVRTTDESGLFITSDHPVVLIWKDPESHPPFYRNHPGFGLSGTQVLFPISSKVAIIGEFKGNSGDVTSTLRLTADFNSMLLNISHKQIYAPKLAFPFIGKDGEILEGKYLLSVL